MKVGICGATGYSGRELVKILLRHPKVEIAFLTSEQFSGQPYAQVFPEFMERTKIICQNLVPEKIEEKVDLVFLALPHTLSMQVAKKFLKTGAKVIDLSGDFRLPKEIYEKWYGHAHEDLEGLSQAVYGMTELFRKDVKKASLIANPGCYPTATCLGLIPAIHNGWISSEEIIVDAKSGVSGAGRSLSLTTLFAEAHENMKAYKIGVHQHTPEIEKIVGHWSKREMKIMFVPHLIPLENGILCTMYGTLNKKAKTSEILASYKEFYKNEKFIRVLPEKMFPQTKAVLGTNYCDIGLQVDERTGKLIMVSAIDNMVKGAAGQAVQNMNVMCGYPEDMALI